ncbi:hypothetical protein EC991_003105 [Linnemannia zychae]|nr:hypothetical protein EC991_003105 [Linnemannia zychae]
MLLNKIALALAVASLAAAEFVDRIPPVTGGCPEGYVQTKKICKIKNKPDVCCPINGRDPKRNDYRKCIPQLTTATCPTATFACPDNYGGNCCPDNSFCGTVGNAFGCYT